MVFPSLRGKLWSLQKHLSPLAVPFPHLRRKQKPAAKLSQHFGNLREHIATRGLFVFTLQLPEPLQAFPLCSLPLVRALFFQSVDVYFLTLELLCMFLQFCLYQQLPSALPAPSAQTWQRGDQTNTAAPVSLPPPAAHPLPEPTAARVQVEADGFEVEV